MDRSTRCGQRKAEPWFDPEGFRLHERDGKLAAFCWTKVHSDTSPPMGEIYVIAVDPTFHGLGLGKALTIAGLDHLAARGLTVGMLHVDGANTAAIGHVRAAWLHCSSRRPRLRGRHIHREAPHDWSASMTDTTETLPRWSVADVHESFESRSFVDALEQIGADSTRLAALFDEHDIRTVRARGR